MSTYQYLENEVEIWARNRGIVQNSTPLAQARKTLEECGELIEAAAHVHAAHPADSMLPVWRNEYRDALADVLITLIVGAACADVNLTECLEEGYETIKNRKGYLRPDGVFVKE